MTKITSEKILLDAGIQNPENVLQTFDVLLKLGVKALGADEGSLLVYRKKQKNLMFVTTVGGKQPKNFLTGKTVPIGKGVTGMAAMQHEVLTGTRASGTNFFNVPDDGNPPCVIAAPLLLDNELIGVITAVSFDEDKSFSMLDCQKYALVAKLGAIFIRQEQQIASLQTGGKYALTEQEVLKMKAVEQTVNCLKAHPDKGGTILQILTMLSEI